MIAIYAGSFDPPTKGHLRVIEEALRLFDEVHVLVATNSAKKPMFNPAERVFMLARCLHEYKGRAKIGIWDDRYDPCPEGQETTPRILVRGLRTVSDFESEMTMAHVNESLGLHTVFIPAGAEGGVSYVSSSIVREFGATERALQMVPEPVARFIRETRGGVTVEV